MQKLLRTNANHPDFTALVKLLNEDLAIRDGEDNSFYTQFNGTEQLKQVVVLYINDIPAACGAIKKFDNASAEVKRMFVLPEYRGKGLASKVLAVLENWGKELHNQAFVLETGLRQPEAIALYKKNDYTITDNYPPYVGVENSVCFRKAI